MTSAGVHMLNNDVWVASSPGHSQLFNFAREECAKELGITNHASLIPRPRRGRGGKSGMRRNYQENW